MYQPMIEAKAMSEVCIREFGGINETDTIKDNEFAALSNISSHAAPYLATRPHRKRISAPQGVTVKKILRMEGEDAVFTGLGELGGKVKFFYRSKCVKKDGTEDYQLETGSMAQLGGVVYLFPDGLYFDPEHAQEGLQSMTVKKSGTMVFSSTEKKEVITNTISSVENASEFSKGDSIVIRGCSNEKNNTVSVDERANAVARDDIVSVVVEKAEGNTLQVLCYNAMGEQVKFSPVTSACTIERELPPLMHVCVHNNRVWGTEKGGKRIWASKLGDAANFHVFAGLSTDSWWGEVASEGEFTGIVSYQSHVYAFKKHCIHEVYGDRPSNFKIPYTTKLGCTKGETVTEIDGVLYFSGIDGIYRYNGGLPENISQKLTGQERFCAGETDGRRLYLALEDGGMLVYDTRFAAWYQEDGAFSCFFREDGVLFAAGEDGIYCFGEGEEYISWEIKTKRMRPSTSLRRGIDSIWLRMELAEGTRARVSICFDDRETTFCREIVSPIAQTMRVPVRMRKCDQVQVMLEGEGDMKLYAIEYRAANGGKNMFG
jgi:hypothetical protein|nr:MAG TPA: stabilization protein [Caudoviricetes sp.]